MNDQLIIGQKKNELQTTENSLGVLIKTRFGNICGNSVRKLTTFL